MVVRLALIVVLLLVGAAGYALVERQARLPARADEAGPGIALRRGPFEVSVAASGLIQAVEVIDVGSQVSGQLAQLHVRLGDRVEAGQLLAEIDDRHVRARLIQAEAGLDHTRAQIRARQAQLTLARIQQERVETLAERDSASRAQVDQVRAATETLVAEIDALVAQASAQAAAVEAVRLDLANTRITAPVTGIVTALVAQRGQTLNATQQAPTILRLSRDDPLLLVLRIPEADAERVRAGQSVRFSLLGGGTEAFETRLSLVLRAPTIINEVVYYDGLAHLDGRRHPIAFGRTVQGFVIVQRVDCAVHLPRGLLPGPLDARRPVELVVRSADGQLISRRLALALVDDAAAAIDCEEAERAGLQPTDRLIRARLAGWDG